MAVTTTAVIAVRARVPFYRADIGDIVLDPAWTTFVNAARPLTVDGHIYEQERSELDWSQEWRELEFITTTANTAALETAANTLQTSLNSQNGNPATPIVVDAQASNSTRVTFS